MNRGEKSACTAVTLQNRWQNYQQAYECLKGKKINSKMFEIIESFTHYIFLEILYVLSVICCFRVCFKFLLFVHTDDSHQSFPISYLFCVFSISFVFSLIFRPANSALHSLLCRPLLFVAIDLFEIWYVRGRGEYFKGREILHIIVRIILWIFYAVSPFILYCLTIVVHVVESKHAYQLSWGDTVPDMQNHCMNTNKAFFRSCIIGEQQWSSDICSSMRKNLVNNCYAYYK